ncbi:hypothetical protein BJX70DRAFT_399608 [Aspergillus crustosus]
MRVLIFGGNGRVARAMTQLMLARSWHVAAIIRNPAQEASLLKLASNQPASMSSPHIIDRTAAKASIAVSKFLIISFPAARRRPAPWWTARDIRDYEEERTAYPEIWGAKVDADEFLVAMAEKRRRGGCDGSGSGHPFQAISLRPT